MRKKMYGYSVIFSLCMSLLMPTGGALAGEFNVRVTLPNFEVKLNGHKVENQFREYPLLVYRDITYFPMTWYDTRLLGLEANWSQGEGLNIKQKQVTSILQNEGIIDGDDFGVSCMVGFGYREKDPNVR
ncbi:hypothetical protein ACYEXS_29955 [Paenibacillus sp. MAH-36]|uniref:hypothetical protein n=1 Tax=Paenibacillus sp. GCM10012304 TaxID=3317341 RepID=UPI00361CACFA